MMEWNVYLEDVNRKEIQKFNVFEHGSFLKGVQVLLSVCSDKVIFAKELESTVKYYFSWKCEYEVILTSWPPYISREEVERLKREETPRYRTTCDLEIGKKIDVAQQLALNWDRFVDYCWSFIPTTGEKPVQKVKVRKVNK